MLIWIEIVVGFAVPISWALWELWSLKREKKRDALTKDRASG